jgi:hypothetical protein
MVGGAWAGLTRWRFGVKVRAELDRVSGLALMPIRRLVDDVRRLPFSRFGWIRFVVLVGYVSSGVGVCRVSAEGASHPFAARSAA